MFKFDHILYRFLINREFEVENFESSWSYVIIKVVRNIISGNKEELSKLNN